jgi:hypothetical protein
MPFAEGQFTGYKVPSNYIKKIQWDLY